MTKIEKLYFKLVCAWWIFALGSSDSSYFEFTSNIATRRSEHYQFYKSDSSPHISRSDHGSEYENTSLFGRTSDLILFPSSIIHPPSSPSSSSSSTDDSDRVNFYGHQCILFGGLTGTCKPPVQCKTFLPIHAQIIQSHRLVHCGRSSDLICCPRPGSDSSSDTTASPTSTTALPVKKDTPVNSDFENSPVNWKPPISSSSVPHASQGLPSIQSPVDAKTGNDLGVVKKTENSVTKTQNQFESLDPEEVQGVCGVYTEDTVKANGDRIWPWTVSIGKLYENGTIYWTCLGSLITKEYVLTAAICLEQNSNVIAVGKAFLGSMTSAASRDVDIHRISHLQSHEKFITPHLYKNIGLIQISSPISVSQSQLPVCFPFLAGVLDIIAFVGTKAKTIGFNIPVHRRTGVVFGFQEYRILNNTQCANVFAAQMRHVGKRFPYGIKNDNMCGIQRNPGTLCQAPGAPLVIFDDASSSYVQIGISSGDPTCSELRRQIVTFSRLSSFSNWLRERVGQLPSPPTCYF